MTNEEIDRAICAHELWKARLKFAIANAKLEVPVEDLYADNLCNLGKWLHNTNPGPEEQDGFNYSLIRDLHTEFHEKAAQIAELVLNNKKDEAMKLIAPGGEYSSISEKLTRALMMWKKANRQEL